MLARPGALPQPILVNDLFTGIVSYVLRGKCYLGHAATQYGGDVVHFEAQFLAPDDRFSIQSVRPHKYVFPENPTMTVRSNWMQVDLCHAVGMTTETFIHN